MALPFSEKVYKLKGEALFDYFCDYAKYDEESPDKPYRIRLGSRTLFHSDTAELWQDFRRAILAHQLRERRSGK